MTDRPDKEPASPELSTSTPIEQVEIRSRSHRPLIFEVHGHGAVRLGAFQTIKLPAFAVNTHALRALLAEGAVIVLEKAIVVEKENKEQAPPPDVATEPRRSGKTARSSRGVPKPPTGDDA